MQNILPKNSIKWIRSFGRLKGKNFSADADSFLEFSFNAKNFDFKTQELSLEIGYGYGEHLAQVAKANPKKKYIGAEVYLNGIANIIKNIKLDNIDNIFLWNKDARILLEEMPDAALQDIFLLFPDPWPKKRHHKRRIVNQKFLTLIAKKMRRNFIVATDHEEYAYYIKQESEKVFDCVQDVQDDLINTRYKKKANTQIRIYKISKCTNQSY